MKNEGFGGEVKWEFPKGTSFEEGHWYKKFLVNKHEKIKEKKKEKSTCKRIERSNNPWKRKIDLIKISSNNVSNNDSWVGIFMT